MIYDMLSYVCPEKMLLRRLKVQIHNTHMFCRFEVRSKSEMESKMD